MRILLVEDDRKASSLLSRGLVEEGFAVDAAYSAEEAAECLNAQDYRLIILDWFCRASKASPGVESFETKEFACRF